MVWLAFWMNSAIALYWGGFNFELHMMSVWVVGPGSLKWSGIAMFRHYQRALFETFIATFTAKVTTLYRMLEPHATPVHYVGATLLLLKSIDMRCSFSLRR